MEAALNLGCPDCGAAVGDSCRVGGVRVRTCSGRTWALIEEKDRKQEWRSSRRRNAAAVKRKPPVRRSPRRGWRDYSGYSLSKGDYAVAVGKAGEQGFESLSAFWHSKGWRLKRKVYFETHPGACCFVCGGDERLALHHITYERLGKEYFKDLVPMCSTHHTLTHIIHMEGVPLKESHIVARVRCEEGLPAGDVRRRDAFFGRVPISREVERWADATPTFERLYAWASGPVTATQVRVLQELSGWKAPQGMPKAQANELLGTYLAL